MKKITLLISLISLCFAVQAQDASFKISGGGNHFMGFNSALKQVPETGISPTGLTSRVGGNFHTELAIKLNSKAWINLQYGRGFISFATSQSSLYTPIAANKDRFQYPLVYQLFMLGFNYDLYDDKHYTLKANVGIGSQVNTLTNFRNSEIINNQWDNNRSSKPENINILSPENSFCVQLGFTSIAKINDYLAVTGDVNFFGSPFLPGSIRTINYTQPSDFSTGNFTLSHLQFNFGLMVNIFAGSKADVPAPRVDY